ncbi:beclin 1-associated autophagy-related key regulator-like [Diadema antillarum]|uniref:beclin 1-associated autophagy-related key regulator-like n=1 Tax=Diadema antillarum TaxID=105358 RepID=UPI003A896BB1
MAAYRDSEEISADDDVGRFVPPLAGMCIAFEKCPLCFTTRRPFTCASCVEKGDFCHSSSKSAEAERYCERRDRLMRLRKEKERLSAKLCERLRRKNAIAEKHWEVSLMKGRLQMTQKAIADEKSNLDRDKQSLQSVVEKKKLEKIRRDEHNKKLQKIQKYMEHIGTNIESRKESLEEKSELLQVKRREKITQLLHHIFPITEINQSVSHEEGWRDEVSLTDSKVDEQSAEDELVAALAEARMTSYVRGRWVETINNGEAHYSIVHPHVQIPANGDYSAYVACVVPQETDIPDPDAELDLHNPGHQVAAALTYTAQLVAHIANTLDVPLVRRVHFSRFCKSELSRREFSSAVDKLNSSVLFLCFSQSISPEKLHPHYTLRNLITLVASDTPSYGRTADFEVHSDLLLAAQTSPNLTSMLSMSGSGSLPESLDEEEDSIASDQEEWETVPTSLPLPAEGIGEDVAGHSPSPPEASPSVMSVSTLPQAAGLMSSAAASVASLWRAATSQREKR